MVFGVQQGLKVAAQLAADLGICGCRAPHLPKRIQSHAPHLGSITHPTHGQKHRHHLLACLQGTDAGLTCILPVLWYVSFSLAFSHDRGHSCSQPSFEGRCSHFHDVVHDLMAWAALLHVHQMPAQLHQI